MISSSQGIMLLSSSLLFRTQWFLSDLEIRILRFASFFPWTFYLVSPAPQTFYETSGSQREREPWLLTCVVNTSWWSCCSQSRQGLRARFHWHSQTPSKNSWSFFWQIVLSLLTSIDLISLFTRMSEQAARSLFNLCGEEKLTKYTGCPKKSD